MPLRHDLRNLASEEECPKEHKERTMGFEEEMPQIRELGHEIGAQLRRGGPAADLRNKLSFYYKSSTDYINRALKTLSRTHSIPIFLLSKHN